MPASDKQPISRYADIARATRESAASGKPLLLHWNARWCPPCQELRVGVLDTEKFARVAAECVVADVSGDSPGAQIWGDRLRLTTYPTTLLLSPRGEEITRLATGLSAERFCSALSIAIETRRTVGELTRAIMETGAALSEAEVTLLAYHSWNQDEHTLARADRPGFFDTLSGQIRDGQRDESARVLAQRIIEGVALANGAAGPARSSLRRQLASVLSGPAATYGNFYYLNVNPQPAIEYLTPEFGADRASLVDAWSESLENMLVAEALSATQRLIAHAALVQLRVKSDSGQELSPQLIRRCMALVEEVEQGTADTAERQSVMNMAGHLLRLVGLPDEARRVFERELSRSADPYYFMPYLADLARERGAIDEGLNWMQRAHHQACGEATRFALGGRLLSYTIAVTPDDVTGIANAALQPLREVEGGVAVFYGVFRRTLGVLIQDLVSWAGTDPRRRKVLDQVREALMSMANLEVDYDSQAEVRAAAQALLPGVSGVEGVALR